MTTIESLAAYSSLFSLVSVPFGVVQFFRYRVARDALRRLKTLNKNRLWGDIQLLLEAYETLDEARNPEHAARMKINMGQYHTIKIASARKGVVALYLRLLEHAINEEEEFTSETAKRWFESGRLENEWRYKAALRFAN